MDIKIYALISLLPLIYVIRKIILRNDLTCFDILLIFHTIYFALVPLIFNINDITYKIVRESKSIHFMTFFYYNLFAYALIFMDVLKCKISKGGLFDITYCLRKSLYHINFDNQILVLVFIIQVFLWWYLSFSNELIVERGVGTMEMIRKVANAQKTWWLILCKTGATLLMPYTTVLLCGYYIRMYKRKINILFYLLCICQIVIYIQVSRTYIFEVFALLGLVVYSLKRKTISKLDLVKIGVVILVIVYILFPIVSVYRAVSRTMIAQKKESFTFVDVVRNGVSLIKEKGLEITNELDNKDTRVWNVYQAVAYSVNYPYNYNGRLTAEAISFSIPKIIYPYKSQKGSQLMIEEDLQFNTDVADSVFMFSLLENRYVGAFYAAFLFFCIISFWNLLMRLFLKYVRGYVIYCVPLFVIGIFCILNRVENSVDGLFSSTMQMLIWCFMVWILINVIKKIGKIRI